MTTSPEQTIDSRWFNIPNYHWTKDQSPPSALLRSDCHDGVPFVGREEELGDIMAWCDSSSQLLIRVYSGESGVGKNRLFSHVCWQLNEANKAMGGGFLKDVALSKDSKPVPDITCDQLWVVDDAEVRSHAIVNLLKLAQNTDGVRIRLVLLTRQLGEWWQWLNQPKHGLTELLADQNVTELKALQPLVLNQQDRQQLFTTTHHCFARMLGRQPVTLSHQHTAWDEFENMALLQMAALVSLFPELMVHPNVNLTRLNVLDSMLALEQAFWYKRLQAQGLSEVSTDAVKQAVSVISAASGAESERETLAMFAEIESLNHLSDDQQRMMATWLNRCYGRRKWIDALYPDVLAQHMMDQTFSIGEFSAVLP